MGHLYDDHGRISVEGRRESFYVHASYGDVVRDVSVPLHQLVLGDTFYTASGLEHVVSGLLLDGTVLVRSTSPAAGTADKELDPDLVVTVRREEFDSDEPLARLWSEHPHPEFANDDLHDLIVALQEYEMEVS